MLDKGFNYETLKSLYIVKKEIAKCTFFSNFFGIKFTPKRQNHMTEKCIKLESIPCINLDLTLDCGQSFRWNKKGCGNWCAVVSTAQDGKTVGKYVEVSQHPSEDGKTCDLIFHNSTEDDVENIWKPYFDLDRDYDSICNTLHCDTYIGKAIDEFYGIRILNQEPWETLCSFIISQNNNIPRIKGIIDRLCENFGEPVATVEDKILYSFPSADTIATLTAEDLSPLRAGFRNKYIIDAAQKVASGEVDLAKIKELPLDEAEAELLKIKGVGPKVAQCALLYGCGQIDAFPVDVWVKRIMGEMYPGGLPACTDGIRGIAQQYLFHWRRNSTHENFNFSES